MRWMPVLLLLVVTTSGCLDFLPIGDASTPEAPEPSTDPDPEDETADPPEETEDPSPSANQTDAQHPTMTVLNARLVLGCGYDDPRYDCHLIEVEVDARASEVDADPGAWNAWDGATRFHGLKQEGPDSVPQGTSGVMTIRFVVDGGTVTALDRIAFDQYAPPIEVSADIPAYG